MLSVVKIYAYLLPLPNIHLTDIRMKDKKLLYIMCICCALQMLMLMVIYILVTSPNIPGRNISILVDVTILFTFFQFDMNQTFCFTYLFKFQYHYYTCEIGRVCFPTSEHIHHSCMDGSGHCIQDGSLSNSTSFQRVIFHWSEQVEGPNSSQSRPPNHLSSASLTLPSNHANTNPPGYPILWSTGEESAPTLFRKTKYKHFYDFYNIFSK